MLRNSKCQALADDSFSGALPRPFGRLPLAPGRGFEPRSAASKAAVLPLNEPGSDWSGRGDSNPYTHGLNVLDMPDSPTPRISGGDGRLEPSKPEGNWFTASRICRSATSPDIGTRGRIRTDTAERLGLVPPAELGYARVVGRAGVEPALVPCFEHGASAYVG